MNIEIVWHGDQFNIDLASKEGADPFLQVKGCRIVEGSKGAFVSYPATKNQTTGKYWNHVWGGEKFNAVVLSKALESQPSRSAAGAKKPNKPESDFNDPIPF